MTDGQPDGTNPRIEASRLVAYLPSIYRRDEFIGRFLRIFEDVFTPLESNVGTLSSYFNPLLTTPECLPWIAGWLDVALDDRIPLARQRQMVSRASELYRRRGTWQALAVALDVALGLNVKIDEKPGSFSVTFDADDVDRDLVSRIVETQRPAHVSYEIRVAAKSGPKDEPGGRVDSGESE